MSKRTHPQLVDDSKTLWYEFRQLCDTAAKLRTGNYNQTDATIHNALVESFAVHCRILSHFFFAGHPPFNLPQADDLDVLDYASSWSSVRPSPNPVLVAAKTQADKQVAHLTEKRRNLNFVPGTAGDWAIDQMERELKNVLGLFLGHADQSKLDPAILPELRALAASPPPAGEPHVVSSGLPLPSLTAKTEAKTDVRTLMPGSGPFGKTE